MTAPRFDWSLVPAFLAVLDAGSLMGAARRMGAQQPTLSRQVAALEAQLGVALFERTGRGTQPTAAALTLAEAARQMALGADQFGQQLLRRARDSAQGTVRLSAPVLAASLLLPPLLAELAEAEPGIQVELVSTDSVSNLLRREADVALRMLRPQQAGLVARKLGESRVRACASHAYLQRAGTPRSSEQLLQHRLVGYDRDDRLVHGFAKAGIAASPALFALRCDDPMAYLSLVLAGAGVGFVADWVLHGLPLTALLPELPTPKMPVWLVVHREIRGNQAVRRVFDFLAERLPERLGV